MGPEVGVEVRGLVETPSTYPAAQVAVSILAKRLRGASGRAIGGAVGAGVAALRLALCVPNAVSDKAVPAERASRGEADATLQALERGSVGSVLGDVALKLCPVLGGEATRDAAEYVVLLFQLVWC